MLFAAVLRVVLVRFSEDEGTVQNLVHLDDDRAGRDRGAVSMMLRDVWGIYTPMMQALSRNQ